MLLCNRTSACFCVCLLCVLISQNVYNKSMFIFLQKTIIMEIPQYKMWSVNKPRSLHRLKYILVQQQTMTSFMTDC